MCTANQVGSFFCYNFSTRKNRKILLYPAQCLNNSGTSCESQILRSIGIVFMRSTYLKIWREVFSRYTNLISTPWRLRSKIELSVSLVLSVCYYWSIMGAFV